MTEVMSGKCDFTEQTTVKEDNGLSSMKGLKSAGDLRVYGGEINLDCYDDGIHSDSNVEIHGGKFYRRG